MIAVPLHGRPKTFLQTDLRSPTDIRELGDVKELLGGAIGLSCVPLGLAGEPDDPCDGLRDFLDGDIAPRAHVYLGRAVIVLEQVQARRGHVIDMEELATWCAGAPVRHAGRTRLGGFVVATDEGWQDV